MAEYQGFKGIMTMSKHSALFRWSSVGNIIESIAPMLVYQVPWMSEPTAFEEYLWQLTYSDTGAWSAHPNRSTPGLYYAPYETGAFGIVSTNAIRNIAVLPGCLIDAGDLGDTVVRVYTHDLGIVLDQDVAEHLPLGATNGLVSRAVYCPDGANVRKIAIALSFKIGGESYFRLSDLVSIGDSFTFNNQSMRKVGVSGDPISSFIPQEHVAGSASDYLGESTLFVVGFSGNPEGPTAYSSVSKPSGQMQVLDKEGYGGEHPNYVSIIGSFEAVESAAIAGLNVAVVNYVEESDRVFTDIPLAESDFGEPVGEGYLSGFYFWSQPYSIPSFWTGFQRSIEMVGGPDGIPGSNVQVFELVLVAGDITFQPGAAGFLSGFVGSLSPESITLEQSGTMDIYAMAWFPEASEPEPSAATIVCSFTGDGSAIDSVKFVIGGVDYPAQIDLFEDGFDIYSDQSPPVFLSGITYAVEIHITEKAI